MDGGDPNAVPGNNMYEQPYSRPAHLAGHERQYSESSLKHEFSQDEHRAHDYEYEQARMDGQAVGYDQHQQQHPQQHSQYQQQEYEQQQEYGRQQGYAQQQPHYQQGYPDEPQHQDQGGYHADGRSGGYRL